LKSKVPVLFVPDFERKHLFGDNETIVEVEIHEVENKR